jgi:Trypsin
MSIANPNAQNTAYETAINEVVVPVLNRETCNEWLETLNVTDGMICAGYSVSIKSYPLLFIFCIIK